MAFLFNRSDKDVLKEVIADRRYLSQAGASVSPPKNKPNSSREYTVVLDATVDACVLNEDGSWTVGEGTGKVWRRDNSSDQGHSMDPENEVTSLQLIPARGDDNSCFNCRVFNLLSEEVPPCVPIRAVADVWGDLWIETNSTSIAATTTTTTPEPCTSRCKWIWDGTVWVLDFDGCNGSTSTTTTEAPPTTTTTTPPP
jgi:hypothetical protein